MLDTSLYLILAALFLFTVLFVALQIKSEKKLLKKFPQDISYIEKFTAQKEPYNEFCIRLIMIGMLPLTGRGRCILLDSDVSCVIYKDFVVFKIKDCYSGKVLSRIVNKENIKTKWDLFAGNIICFKTENINLTFQVYSRIENFKKYC